jgi:hypothetical protein
MVTVEGAKVVVAEDEIDTAFRRGLGDDVDRGGFQLHQIDIGGASLDGGEVGAKLLPPS